MSVKHLHIAVPSRPVLRSFAAWVFQTTRVSFPHTQALVDCCWSVGVIWNVDCWEIGGGTSAFVVALGLEVSFTAAAADGNDDLFQTLTSFADLSATSALAIYDAAVGIRGSAAACLLAGDTDDGAVTETTGCNVKALCDTTEGRCGFSTRPLTSTIDACEEPLSARTKWNVHRKDSLAHLGAADAMKQDTDAVLSSTSAGAMDVAFTVAYNKNSAAELLNKGVV